VTAAFKPTKNKPEVKKRMAVYVGIDVHKKYCQAALMNDNGRVVQELISVWHSVSLIIRGGCSH
jgi:activator of 2-hydroxyglutaryl-CoA dehydratase